METVMYIALLWMQAQPRCHQQPALDGCNTETICTNQSGQPAIVSTTLAYCSSGMTFTDSGNGFAFAKAQPTVKIWQDKTGRLVADDSDGHFAKLPIQCDPPKKEGEGFYDWRNCRVIGK
jgi:hypothetical protein